MIFFFLSLLKAYQYDYIVKNSSNSILFYSLCNVSLDVT